MKPVFERRDDAEVAAAPSESPEQLRILDLARADDRPVGRHEVSGDQVVAGEPEASLEPAAAAADGEARYPRVRDAPAGDRQAEGLSLTIELAPVQTCLGKSRGRLGIHSDPLHRADVDHDSVVDAGIALNAVRAAANGDLEPSARAYSIAATTSVTPVQRAIIAGRREYIPLWTIRAAS